MIKKLLKIIGLLFLALILLIVLLLVVASFIPSVPNNYTKTVKTGGEIEAAYMKMGQYDVKYYEEDAAGDLGKFEVYYPSEMTEKDRQWPLVHVLNGTGVSALKCKALFQHLASWGFIVVGNEHPSTGYGTSTEETLEYILKENEKASSFLYHKIDTTRIGLTGHSQGGAGVFTVLSLTDHRSIYKTVVALSPTHEETAHQLGWMYNPEDVKVPVLMLAGTVSDFETKLVIPIEAMNEMFTKINAPKVKARRIGADHGMMLYSADGYVTAWFCWQLQNDENASKAFVGENAELLHNSLYQDQEAEL